MVRKWHVRKCTRRDVLLCILSVQILITARQKLSPRWDFLVSRCGFAVARFMESVSLHQVSHRTTRVTTVVAVLIAVIVRETITVKSRSYHVTAKKSKI